MEQRYIDLYNEYLDAPLRRRILLLRLYQMTGSEDEALALAKALDANCGRPGRGQPGWRAARTRSCCLVKPRRGFVKAVGKLGRANLEFNTPHSIATDFQGNVYVGDRGNARVQVLDNDLNLKAVYDTVGNPWAVCVSGGPGPKNPGKQYLYVSNSWPDSAPAAQAQQRSSMLPVSSSSVSS